MPSLSGCNTQAQFFVYLLELEFGFFSNWISKFSQDLLEIESRKLKFMSINKN